MEPLTLLLSSYVILGKLLKHCDLNLLICKTGIIMYSYVVSIIYEISLCCLVHNRHSISSAYFSFELLIILAVNISLSPLSCLLIPEILTGFPKYSFSYKMLKKRRCFLCWFVFDHSYGLWTVLKDVTAGGGGHEDKHKAWQHIERGAATRREQSAP